MGKDVALYLGNPQRHALNRTHCKKEGKKTTELETTTLTAGKTLFPGPVLFYAYL